jgi:hypothetical protein
MTELGYDDFSEMRKKPGAVPCDHDNVLSAGCPRCLNTGILQCPYGGYCTCRALGSGDEACPGFATHSEEDSP